MVSENLQWKFDLIKGQDTISNSLNELLKKTKDINSSFNTMSTTLKKVGVAAIGLVSIGKAIDFIGESINSAAAAEDSINGLASAMESAGNFSQKALKNMTDFASQIQRTTRYSDEQVNSTAALIESLTRLDVDGLQRATEAALNLATALRIDVGTASAMIGKAAEGNTMAFSRYGIIVEKGATNTETFANVLKLVESRFSGRMQSDANTFSGSMAQLTNAFDDFKETIGNFIIQSPALITVFRFIQKQIIQFTESLNKASGGTDILKPIILQFLELARTLNYVIKLAEILKNVFILAFNGIRTALQGVITEILGKFSLVGSLIEKVIGPTQITTALRDMSNSANEVLADFTAQTNDSFANLIDPKSIKVDEFINELVNQISATGGKLIAAGENITSGIQEGMSKNPVVQEVKFSLTTAIADAFYAKFNEIMPQIANRFKNSLSPAMIQGGTQLVASIAKGKEGAAQIMGELAGAVADRFIPGLGGLVKQVFSFLSMGPEQAAAMLDGFIQGIPQIINGIIDSIPVLTEQLLMSLGSESFISGMVRAMVRLLVQFLPLGVPEIIKVFSSPKFYMSIAKGIISGISKGLSDAFKPLNDLGKVFQALADAFNWVVNALRDVGNFLKGLTGGGGGGGGIGGFFKKLFTHGGIVPRAANGLIAGNNNFGDKQAVLVNSGEVILNKAQQSKLFEMANGKTTPNNGMLEKIFAIVSSPIQIQTALTFNQREFANILLDLNRANARTTA